MDSSSSFLAVRGDSSRECNIINKCRGEDHDPDPDPHRSDKHAHIHTEKFDKKFLNHHKKQVKGTS